MRRPFLAGLLVVLSGAAAAAMPRAPEPYVDGQVVARYRSDAGPARVRQLGMVPRRRLLSGRAELLAVPAYMTVAGALEVLRQDPDVLYAEPNFRRFRRAAVPPNDPLFAQQWGLLNTGQSNFFCAGPPGAAGADLNMVAAWDSDGDGVADRTGDASVVVAVIDDAVDVAHEDLAPNLVAGYDFRGRDSNPRPSNDEQFHGTLVTGCIAAAGDNGIGVAGVAWSAKVMPLKFDFDVASHIAALEFAADHGARIVNASFGGPGFSQLELDAIRALANGDILYVAAAGNDDSNTDVAQLNYPANYDADNVVSVAATNRQDDIASFSQYGPITVDVAAPGLQVVTTAINDAYAVGPASCIAGGDGGTAGVSGTSFASPYVAGVAALLRSHVAGPPGWREMKARLIESGTVAPGASAASRTAGGRVDAEQALEMAPRPALVIEDVALTGGDGNGQLDPGESLTIEVTVRNLWQGAANVAATLAADTLVSVDTAAVTLGTVPADATVSAAFPATVTAAGAQHHYVTFTLSLTADGYAADRSFILEIGRLPLDTVVTQAFAPLDDDLYDEFHAWHVDVGALPEGHDQLVIETTTAPANGLDSPDIDLLAKLGVPPRYNITVGINPEDEGFFCTSGTAGNCRDPDTRISADEDGSEQIVIDRPAPGTYHLVVVNFAQLAGGLQYTVHAYTREAPRRSGGGGGLPLLGLLPVAGAVLLRRALRP